MKSIVKVWINFSGKEFQSHLNNFDKRLPEFKEIAEEVIATIEDGKIIECSHKLSPIDEKFVLMQKR